MKLLPKLLDDGILSLSAARGPEFPGEVPVAALH